MLDCPNATLNGNLTSGTFVNGATVSVPYTGGVAGIHDGQTVSSTGVTGLTATLASGTFASGAGNLTYSLVGTPSAAGTASFALNIGGQTCTLNIVVNASAVYCTGSSTVVVDVINPMTGKVWMDRNLGATQVATSLTDVLAYGDLYQWGRSSDGHQCRTSPTLNTLSSNNQPGHGSFILATNTPYDWRSPQNTNLWQGVNGVNNPCPAGYRLPTDLELESELSWISNSGIGFFESPLKLTLAGYRNDSGSLGGVGIDGYYLSSTVTGGQSKGLFISGNPANSSFIYNSARGYGFTVRCTKD